MDVNNVVSSLSSVSLSDAASVFGTEENQPILRVEHAKCSATIALQGAQVLSFRPTGGNELIWLSPRANFAPGASIRGGIPICLPWFGEDRHYQSGVNHGFVRNREWQFEDAFEDDEQVSLTLSYKSSNEDLSLFPHPFMVKLTVSFGEQLNLTLDVTHDGRGKMPLSWALHTYFMTDSINTARVGGLEGFSYRDKTKGMAEGLQTSAIQFDGEFDRVYETTPDTVVISGFPSIRVSAENQPTTIVWNPGAPLARNMKDVGEGNHLNFVCVERGAVFDDELVLSSGESVRSTLTISES